MRAAFLLLAVLALAPSGLFACTDEASPTGLGDTDVPGDLTADEGLAEAPELRDLPADPDSETGDERGGTERALARGGYTLRLGDGPSLTLERDGAALVVIPADGLQLGLVDRVRDAVNYDPWGFVVDDLLHPAPPLERWTAWTRAEVVDEGDTSWRVALTFDGDDAPTAVLEVHAPAEGRFRLHLVPDSPERVAYLRVRVIPDPDEGLYGLGETFDRAEHRGTARAMQLELDAALEGASNEAHVPVPLLLGTTGWALFVEDEHPAAFDVAAADPERVDAVFGTGVDSAEGLVFHLFGAAHPLDLLAPYYAITGSPAVPAPWALGPLLWRNENRDQDQVAEDAEALRDLDLAATGIWLDRPYATAVNTFDFETTRFPDPPAMLAHLRDLGLAVALWHTPYLDESAPATAELRAVAEDEGYYPPETGPLLNRWGRPLDLTNPDARAFWQDHLRAYTDAGIAGFKLDYGEDIVPGLAGGRSGWRFADGRDERTMHAAFQRDYHSTYAALLPDDGGFLLCRGGTFGDQVYASVIWPGDIDASFARHGEAVSEPGGDEYVAVGGLPAALVAALSLGASGFPLFGADTGGYRHSPPDAETLLRWTEVSALSTVMQVGNAGSGMPWELLDEAGLDVYRRYARLHLRLFPYLWTYLQRLATDGRPLQRALGLAFPELHVHPSDEYLLGDDLLVAPVVERGATARALHLPPGDWVDWWTGARHSGPGPLTVDAPLDTLPLFLRAGGLVPLLRPEIDTLLPTAVPERVDSFATAAGRLTVVTTPGPPASFALYDGAVLLQSGGEGDVTVTLEPGDLFDAGFDLEVIAFGEAPAGVLLDGLNLEQSASAEAFAALADDEAGWRFVAETRGGTLFVHVPAAGGEVQATRE